MNSPLCVYKDGGIAENFHIDYILILQLSIYYSSCELDFENIFTDFLIMAFLFFGYLIFSSVLIEMQSKHSWHWINESILIVEVQPIIINEMIKFNLVVNCNLSV